MNESPSVERGSIFVWSHFGKKLQKLDKDRYFAISQNSPHEFLSRIYNRNMEKIIHNMNLETLFDDIEHENYLDNLFRQVSTFMRSNGNTLDIGSALTGVLDKQVKTGKLVKRIKLEELDNE